MDISRKQWLLFAAFIMLFSAGWIGITSVYFNAGTNGEIPAPKEGFLAPDFELITNQGTTQQLSALEGQVVLVNIWASWCMPCRQEMPTMQQVFETYQDQGFTILAVHATSQDSQANALDFVNELQLTFPILFDLDGVVARKYLVNAFPSSYFVDKNGKIAEVVIGGPMSAALLQTRVEKLLMEEK